MRATILTLAALLAGATPSWSSAPPVLELTGPPAKGRWVEVTPVQPGPAAKDFSIKDDARSVSLEGVAPGLHLVCAGAEERGTRCERLFLEAGKTSTMAGAAEGARVTGRIRLGRHPASGVRVRVVPTPLSIRRLFIFPFDRKDGKLTGDVVTDEQGRFAIPVLAPGSYHLDLRTPGGRIEAGDPFTVPDLAKLRHRVDPKAPAPAGPPLFDLGEILLDEGLRVEVLVTNSAGQPVPGAGVGGMQERRPGEAIFFEARAEADGKATLSELDGSLGLSVACQAAGYARSEQRFDSIPAQVSCSLERLAAIEGKIVDEDGKAVKGATVSLRQAGRVTQSDAEGRFELPGLTRGEHRLQVAAPGHRAVEREVVLAAEERRKLDPIRLGPAEPLAGVVVDGQTGEPVSGAVLAVLEPPGAGSATTGEDGTFRLEAESDGPLVLEVTAQEYPAKVVEAPGQRTAGEEPFRIELAAGGRVRVLVWDEEADAPCMGCVVSFASNGGRARELTTDGHGETLSELVAPGRYSVTRIRLQTFGSVMQVSGGDDVRFVEVKPGQVAEVRFGERRSTIEVAFSPPPPSGWRLSARAGTRSALVESRPNGVFPVRRTAGEAMILTLIAPGDLHVRQAVIPADFDEATLLLPLHSTRIGGILKRGEEPVPGERIELVNAAGSPAGSVRTDETGSFQVPYLPPGHYTVTVAGSALRSLEVSTGSAVDLGIVLLPD